MKPIKLNLKFLSNIRKNFFSIGMDADDDWRIILVIFILLTSCFFILGVFMFFDARSVVNSEELNKFDANLIDTKELEEVINLYKNKEVQMNILLPNKE